MLALSALLGCAPDSEHQAGATAGTGADGGSSATAGSNTGAASGSGVSSAGSGSGAGASGGMASAGTSGASSMAGTGGTTPEPGRPNVILLVADDLGFSDVGAFGGEVQTPNIDSLAEGGLRFTSFFNASRCSPTRASLLTGQYPHRVNLAQNGRNLGRNGLTMAEALGEAGYSTAMSGKWHLSATPELPNQAEHLQWLNHQLDPGVPFSPDVTTYPVGRGFQRHYGPIWGVVNYFDPFSLVDGTTAVTSVPQDFYMTDTVTQKAVDYIRDFTTEAKPFFLYVAFTAPHWPLHARPEDIAKYEGVYDAGWAPIRAARYAKQQELGLFDAESTSLPATQANDWGALSQAQRLFLSNAMQTHAAMVDRVDQGIGEIVATLKATGAFDNTLILFLSDNGASGEIYLNSGFDRPSETRAGEPIVYCGGQAACPYSQPGSQTTYAYLGPSWANAANTPFRYWKGDSFRGGNNTPVIAHWPAGLTAEPGSITDQPAHVIDVLPTVLELTGVDYPETYEGHALTSLDGTSLTSVLAGEEREPHEAMFFEHEGGAAMIQGDYKIVRLKGSQWELYDLSLDRTETTNLAASESARVQSMSQAWQAWYASVDH